MKRHLAVLLCYILLAGLSLYNPVLHTGTHLPGTLLTRHGLFSLPLELLVDPGTRSPRPA